MARLEIWPDGDRAMRQELGWLEIVRRSDGVAVASYAYEFIDGDGARSGLVRHHRRSDGAWELLRRILVAERRRGRL